MIQQQLTIPQWLNLPIEIRQKLVTVFNIPKSVGCHVVDGHVVSDGHTHEDLANITFEKMQTFLGSSETEFWKLLNMVLDKLNGIREAEIDEQIARAEEEKRNLNSSKIEVIKEFAQEMFLMAEGAAEEKRKPGRPKKVVEQESV